MAALIGRETEFGVIEKQVFGWIANTSSKCLLVHGVPGWNLNKMLK
jgi:hypothetical protein